MIFKRIKSEGLAHYSYIIGDGTEAAVIDPRRDIDIYLKAAEEEGVKIKYILETHRNEDYIIGSKKLAEKTYALIKHSDDQLDYQYGESVVEGDKFKLGRLELEAVHTPGHTKGSHSYILYDFDGSPWMVFSGDALFAGDIGRLDFYGADMIEEMAGRLYDALYNKILPLGDGVILCPAHGAGSVCGSLIAEREWTTIGIEKRSNPRLQYSSREEFQKNVGEMHKKPAYFAEMEEMNLLSPLDSGHPFVPALNAEEFEKLAAEDDTVILDTRTETEFSSAHISGSLSIWSQIISSFVGWLVPTDKKILLVNDGNYPGEIVRQLYRMGYDRISGYLSRGILNWHMSGRKSEKVKTINVDKLCSLIDSGEDYWLLDIRKKEEIEKEGKIANAHEIPLTEIKYNLNQIEKDKVIYIFCGSGMRSMTAASILKREIEADIKVVLGGLSGWSSTTCPIKD